MGQSTTLVLGALGDSITTAFNAEAAHDNLAHSWATGHATDGRVISHLRRLRGLFPAAKVEGVNVAVAGARAEALASQVARLLPERPDYATLLIGANDLHQWLFLGEYGTQLARFKDLVHDAVQRLVAANPRIMIVLSGIPDQSRILELVLRRDGASPILPQLALLSQLPPALAQTLKYGYKERWERANAALRAVAAAFPANVRFVEKTPLVRFAPEHLSPVDFYHPSLAGQRLLADVTWEQGWFP